MAKTFRIDDDVREVLNSATITDRSVVLVGQIDRGLYERVNKVLRAAGGRWSRKERSHVFDRDPRELIQGATASGVARNLKQETQFFPTPPAIAQRMVRLAEILPGHTILEPSAGSGNIIRAIPRKTHVTVTAVEIDPGHFESLTCEAFAVWVRVLVCDFLGVTTADISPVDRVLMNPPFTKGQDIIHIKHACAFLKPGGRMVALCANGPKQRECLMPLASEWHDLPDGSFLESGTKIKTAMLVLNR
jgi:protein-L-isoaspartate O-methyltransferase